MGGRARIEFRGHTASRMAWKSRWQEDTKTLTGDGATRNQRGPDTGGGWINGRGDDTMTMLEGYRHMVDFFTSFDWWKTEPHDELVDNGNYCLAKPGEIYVAPTSHVPQGGVTVQLGPGQYRHVVECDDGCENPLPSLTISTSSWTSPAAPARGTGLCCYGRNRPSERFGVDYLVRWRRAAVGLRQNLAHREGFGLGEADDVGELRVIVTTAAGEPRHLERERAVVGDDGDHLCGRGGCGNLGPADADGERTPRRETRERSATLSRGQRAVRTVPGRLRFITTG